MIVLRDYQKKMYSETVEAIKKGYKRLLIYAAMRSGKTVVFSYFAQKAHEKGSKCLIITERIKLFDQTVGELNNFGVKPELINGDNHWFRTYATCFLAMPISLKNRMHKQLYIDLAKRVDFIMIDECHRTIADWMFEHELFKDKIFLGFTGSPSRSGKQRQLGENYEKIVYGPTTIELEDIKKVNKLKVVSVKFDRDKLKVDRSHTKGDEYSLKGMYDAMNKKELYHGVVKNYKKYTPNTMAICYNVTIIHAIKTCIEFNESGIKSKFITSPIGKPKIKENPTDADKVRYDLKMKDYEMYKKYFKIYGGDEKEVLEEWRNGEFKVLHNVDKYTFGFNEPKLVTTIVNRATISLPLWIQMANRSTTLCEGKDVSYLIDMAGNYYSLGMPNNNHKWNLVHETKESDGIAPIKECGLQQRKGIKPDPITGYYPDKNNKPGCGSYIATSIMICPYCGYLFQTEQEKIEVELQLIDEPISLDQKVVIKELPKWSDIEKDAELRGYKNGWIIANILSKYGKTGLHEYAKSKGYSSGWVSMQEKRYGKRN